MREAPQADLARPRTPEQKASPEIRRVFRGVAYAADRIVKIDYSRRAAEIYGANCRFETIPGGGHIFHGANAQKAAELLRAFALEEDRA